MTTSSDPDNQPWRTPLFAFLLALTILKGIRMPGRWAITHYLFTYQTGFMKRGLWGEVLRLVFGSSTAHYFLLATIGLLVLAVAVALVVLACRALPAGPARIPLLIVLCSSPALAFSAHMVGYLEQIGYLACAMLLVQRRRWRVQVTTAVLAAALLPLVHEASMLWVGALVCLALLVGAPGRERKASTRLAAVAVVAVIWLLSTMAASEFGRVSPERAGALRDDRTAFFEVRPRQDAFHTLTVSLRASLEDMRIRWQDPDVWTDMRFSIAVFAPAAIFFGVLAVRQVRLLDPSPAVQRTTIVLTLLAIAGPLLLHLVGWDRHRWNALASLNAGLATLIMYAGNARAPETNPSVVRSRMTGWALAICLWGLSSDLVLFDGYRANFPPFTEKVQFLIDAVITPDRNLWIPESGR